MAKLHACHADNLTIRLAAQIHGKQLEGIMRIVMDMSSYRQEVSEPDTVWDESSTWSDSYVSRLALSTLHSPQANDMAQGKLPSDLVTLDAELFLQRIYTYQR